MKFPRLISQLYFQPLCIEPSTRMAIERIVNSRMRGDYDDGDSAVSQTQEPFKRLGSLAVISIDGIIGKHLSGMEKACFGGCDLADVEEALSQAENDPLISRVVLNINSPGGSVIGVPEAADAVARLNAVKPVTAFTDSMCASAAYWIASQAGEIVATKSAQVGSIGVYLALLDETRAMEMEGVKVNLIKRGDFKAAGASFQPLTDDERALFQARVDAVYSSFTSAVVSGRGKVATETMQGQCFSAEEAVNCGLVDLLANNLDEVCGQSLL